MFRPRVFAAVLAAAGLLLAPTPARAEYIALDYPGSAGTFATGVSETTVVGFYLDDRFLGHGFVYDRAAGTFAPVRVPGAADTVPLGVDGDRVAGFYTDPFTFEQHGFVWVGRSLLRLDVPGGVNTQVNGVSGDTVVGSYFDPVAGRVRGFVFPVAVVPEPAGLTPLAVGTAGLFGRRFRRR
ncbi:MAG: hypothetical protein K2X82_16270 [Gemmataceae bacterium]|nr:hypothetical protein [Gemmataceae bacterium]